LAAPSNVDPVFHCRQPGEENQGRVVTPGERIIRAFSS
jgi:hypothetical protein